MEQIILFAFLVIFPFGQIIRIGILQPIDVIAGAGALWAILKHYKKPEVFKYFNIFLLIAAFSWILSIFIFNRSEVLYGGLYLVRLAAYFYFFVFVWNLARKSKANGNLLINSLLSVSVVSAIFGWIQYFMIPNTTALKYLGWDDHFLRLIGTILDPTFLGLIIVLGLLISVYRYIESKKILYLFLAVFLVLSLAFTYSRASYLAFFAGLMVILFYYKKLKYLLFVALGFFVVMLFLPTAQNHVLTFTRSFSALSRIDNYIETVGIFKTSPVFGVGYDNLCLARASEAGFINYASHSCSGSDSSLLFVLATTGVVGFMAFTFLLYRGLKDTKYDILYTSSLAALLVHSLFGNSIFYPWIMGYMFILLAVSLRSEV